MGNYFNNNSFYEILYKWKFHILIITILGGLTSFSASLLLNPEYNSYAIVYPVNIAPYSDESNTEQMLQVLKSRDIKDKIISSFNLIEHYNISTEKKDYLNTIYSIYEKNIDLRKTEYESIKITCSDKNPKVAASIIDSIIVFYNQKGQNLYRIKIKEVMDVAKSELIKWQSIQDSLNKTLNFYRESYGIQNYNAQLQEVTRGLYRTNNKNLIQEGKEFLENLSKYGPSYDLLIRKYNQATDEVLKANIAYNKALKEYNKDITYSQVITKPLANYKKNYSKRILIIFLGVISSFILSLVLISFLEKRH